MALGEQLREARLKRNLSPSQVAAGTHMKVQIVEDLEREDFQRIAAPIYGKGFIRLYAEFIGLDANPLIEDYLSLVNTAKKPSLIAHDEELPRPVKIEPDKSPFDKVVQEENEEPDLFARVDVDHNRPIAPSAPARARPNARVERRSMKERVAGLGGSARASLSAAVSKIGAAAGRLKPSAVPRINLRQTPLKAVSVGLLAVVVLVFVVSMLSRCRRPPDPSVSDPQTAEDLRFALEPPDVYVE